MQLLSYINKLSVENHRPLSHLWPYYSRWRLSMLSVEGTLVSSISPPLCSTTWIPRYFFRADTFKMKTSVFLSQEASSACSHYLQCIPESRSRVQWKEISARQGSQPSHQTKYTWLCVKERECTRKNIKTRLRGKVFISLLQSTYV